MVHLHMRSSYSLLESPIRLESMILHQKQLGYNHVCLTDHNVMYGTMEFYQLCKKHNIHPIIGLEVDSIYNDEPFHFTNILMCCENCSNSKQIKGVEYGLYL